MKGCEILRRLMYGNPDFEQICELVSPPYSLQMESTAKVPFAFPFFFSAEPFVIGVISCYNCDKAPLYEGLSVPRTVG